MKVVGLSGSIIGAKTAIAVEAVLQQFKDKFPEAKTELVDMRDYDVEFVSGKPLASYNQDTQTIVAKIIEADVLVIGTPVYQASITGVLKNLFDHLPTTAMKSKIVGMVTTAGSKSHLLVTEYQLKPILAFFKAIIATNNVFLHTSCFNEQNEIVDEEVQNRIAALSNELYELQTKIHGSK